LQWDPIRRFVSVVEADGIVDFGGNYVSFSYYGSDGDFFKQENNADLTPSTRPDTRSTLGANTHISITDISASDTLMSCNISTGWNYEGFPTMMFPDLGAGDAGMMAVDINNDGSKELFAARNSLILALNSDGSFVIDTSFGLILPDFAGDTLRYIVPRFATLDTIVAGRLIAGDFDGNDNDTLEIACFDAAGRLYIFEGYDHAPVDDAADLLDSVATGGWLTSNPVVYDFDGDGDDEIIVGFADSTVYLFDLETGEIAMSDIAGNLSGAVIDIAVSDSAVYFIAEAADNYDVYSGVIEGDSILLSETQFTVPGGNYGGLAVGDINRDNSDEVVITSGDALTIIEAGSLINIDIDNPSAPSLGDVNADGFPDIAVVGLTDNVTAYAFHHNGSLLDGFPSLIDIGDSTGSQVHQPLISDFDDDGAPDIMISYILNKPFRLDFNRDGTYDLNSDLAVGGLTCINNHGDFTGGFPITSAFPVSSEPVISDFDNDGDIDIAMIDSAGFIAAWDIDIDSNPINSPWPAFGGGCSNRSFLLPEYLKPVIAQSGYLADNMVYNYPNPAIDLTTFRYSVDRPSYINIQIFDMSGELVDELEDTAAGENAPGETDWDCSRYASGIYFARVEARTITGNISENTIIKVALIK